MESPVLAKDDVLERVDGDVEFLAELAETFMASFPTQFSELTAAAEKGDINQTERKAHAIKGALRNLGGLKSGESAYKIELAAKKEDLSGIKLLLEELDSNVKDFATEIRALVASSK